LDDEGKPVVLETNKKEEDNNAQTSSENKSISTEINEPEKTVESKENK
jgi:hypothetical protein